MGFAFEGTSFNSLLLMFQQPQACLLFALRLEKNMSNGTETTPLHLGWLRNQTPKRPKIEKLQAFA